jgi:RNA polymerase sigma factor (sigma-70 family)
MGTSDGIAGDGGAKGVRLFLPFYLFTFWKACGVYYLINAYRKVINSPVYEDYMDYLDHHNNTTADSQLEYDDFVRQLNQMLAKLPKTQQEIIRLSKLEMLNNQEIAERLSYSEQTVKNQLSMGLKQLRQLISNRTNLMWLLFLV